ncbi:MAG TPA: 4a-hydroxytetrahydrobiopterin dehydratase [Tepidisphaeraceae bacterium]|nr:4a-hydroxytetrahydrobiopterin dehydratase [Tepidisphaeraceae bacterium]
MSKQEAKISSDQVKMFLKKLPGWKRVGSEIVRKFSFEDYYQTMAFVNAIAWISHRENHHPDLEVGYNKCMVHYSTHSVGGLSAKDFACAAKIEQLMNI